METALLWIVLLLLLVVLAVIIIIAVVFVKGGYKTEQPARSSGAGITGGADGTFHLLYFITFLVFYFLINVL